MEALTWAQVAVLGGMIPVVVYAGIAFGGLRQAVNNLNDKVDRNRDDIKQVQREVDTLSPKVVTLEERISSTIGRRATDVGA